MFISGIIIIMELIIYYAKNICLNFIGLSIVLIYAVVVNKKIINAFYKSSKNKILKILNKN